MIEIESLTLEFFKNDIFSLNPEGVVQDAYDRLLYHLREILMTNGEKPTYDLIKERYHDYLKVWGYRWGAKEKAGFLPKDQVKKTLYEFIGEKMYEQIFQIPKTNQDREEYLFGTENRGELYDQAEQFRKKYNI